MTTSQAAWQGCTSAPIATTPTAFLTKKPSSHVTFVEMRTVIGVLEASFNGASHVAGNTAIANRFAPAVAAEILFVIHAQAQISTSVHRVELNCPRKDESNATNNSYSNLMTMLNFDPFRHHPPRLPFFSCGVGPGRLSL